MGARARLLAVLPMLVLLAWMGLAAHRDGRANSLMADASREMSTWRRATVAAGEWDWIRADLERAAEMDPGNPSISELQGILKARRVAEDTYLKESIAHFQQSLRERPGSPYGWANLLESSYRLHGSAAEIDPMIQRAVALGPHEPAVQRVVADFGLAAWPELSPAGQASTERVVAAALRRNPLEMLRIADRRGRLNVACRHVSIAPGTSSTQWSKFCPGTEATQ